jgi:hypothetical protein
MALLRARKLMLRLEWQNMRTIRPAAWACCTFVLLGAAAALAQTPNNGIIYTRQPTFRIPFETDPGERRLREVQLYVSEDQGQTWQKAGTAPPEQRGFSFRAERDGAYWFAVRTVDLEGRLNPPILQGIRPQLRVHVDTQPPVITLRQGSAREGTISVDWEIRDDNLDLSSFNLEYRTPGAADWIPVTVDPAAIGQRWWSPGTNGPIEVRLRVRDLAKNEGEAKLVITPGGQDLRASGGQADPVGNRYPGRTVPGTRWVNSKRISLNFEIKEQGPSGVSAVELWFTRDGRTWEKYREEAKAEPPLVFDVHDEGVYGFTIVVRSGVGLSERPPRSGDPPQIWVEVDLTKPVVQWLNVDVGRGPDSGKLFVTWKATDKNFAREPITLSYAKEAQGPWTQIAANLENTGRYEWQMPAGVPYRFLVRLEATDKAGNVGVAETPKHVIVDLAQPKGVILGAESVGK